MSWLFFKNYTVKIKNNQRKQQKLTNILQFIILINIKAWELLPTVKLIGIKENETVVE